MSDAAASGATASLELPFVLASGNPDKAREIAEILAVAFDVPLASWAVSVDGGGGEAVAFLVSAPGPVDLPRLAGPPDVEETGATLEENARIKATGLVAATGLWAVADDTGLEVDALGGAPGVRAARYAGEGATYADNVAKLLRELDAAGARDAGARTARFATVATACWPDGREVSARGVVEGVVATAPRGGSGFGYDPVFVPSEGDGRTFAEMSPAEKHALSHRGRAFRALAARLGGGHAVTGRA